jgi:hypothetical protein
MNFDQLYAAVGPQHNLTKRDFMRAIHEGAQQDHYRIGGWPKSIHDITDPALMYHVAGKMMYIAYPEANAPNLAEEANTNAPDATGAPTKEELAKAYAQVRQSDNGKWWAGNFPTQSNSKAEAIARVVTQMRANEAHAAGKPGEHTPYTGNYRDHAKDAELEAMQPKEKPALLNPITAQAAIDQINQKNAPEGGWTDADRVPPDQQAGTAATKSVTTNSPAHHLDATVNSKVNASGKKERTVSSPFYADTIKRLRDGTITHDEFKERGKAWFDNREAIIDGLKARYKESGLRSPEKIDDAANQIYQHVASMFNLGEPVSVVVGFGSLDKIKDRHIEAYRKGHESVTPEKMRAYAEQHAAKIAKREQTMTDPQTLADFDTFTRLKGETSLTPEQRAKYDDLRATDRRERDRMTKQRQATVAPVQQGETPHTIHQGIHTKHGTPIHVVSLTNRVERDHYMDLATKAKQLGGSYQTNSRYSGGKTPDGFNFDTPEKAQRFSELLKGNAVSRAADWDEAADASRESAATRLREMADRVEQRSDETLSQERKTNTARRAGMAANTEANARVKKAHAQTMRRIADALQNGTAKHLAGFRHDSQLSALDTALRMSVYHAERKANANNPYGRSDFDRPATDADIEHATYPYPHFDGADMLQYAKTMQQTKGAKRIGDRLEKFAQERLFKEQNGQRTSEVSKIDDRELLRDLADVATNPAAYGIGPREGGRLRDKMNAYMRLQAADVKNEAELRAALREFRPLKEKPQGEDQVKAAERKLIGRPIPGFFPTPRHAVEEMLDHADIQPGMTVFEPSAGKGDILDAVQQRHPDAVTSGMELDHELTGINTLKGHNVQQGDFTTWAPQEHERPDRIIMNPPFENGQDMDHVQRAYDHLKPGGKMVAIMSEGPFGRSDNKSLAFRLWLEKSGGESMKMPEGTFAGSDSFRQTGVNTRMVVIHKPA